MADKDDIFEMSQIILQIINEVYAEHEASIPNRQYVVVGDAGSTPHDCEQVTVAFGTLGSGLPQSQSAPVANCMNPTNAVYVVEVVRYIPTGSGGNATRKATPSPEDFMKTSKTQMADARLLAEVAKRVGQQTILNSSVFSITAGAPGGGTQGMLLELNIVV